MLDAPRAFMSVAYHSATLAFVRGADFLAVFDEPQRNAMAMLLLNLDKHGTLVSEAFWGLWLLPLGVLIFRSGFMPRFLGGWLFLNGVAYVVMGLLLPQYVKTYEMIVTPILFGEVALMLWLLIVGARARPAEAA
jgi:membrane-bound ClpP family serine protease